ncbi:MULTISPECIES: type III secretion protein [Burkholderia]|uniref:type III secretion protein n=1 Tax=Burkholderia TaxID=32008 RepID=UPI00157A43DA|nr:MULTISPECIES: type III secretion protein [Burkholderia]MCU9952155.1 type III secretion protein [Burkholderia sp. BKH01]NTY37494.1 type III secretion protein [Burkholderia diffusa]
MYEPLEPFARDFNEVRTLLDDPAGDGRLRELCIAIEAVAERLGTAPALTDFDRSNLAKLYRGFLATSRVLTGLQEAEKAPAT